MKYLKAMIFEIVVIVCSIIVSFLLDFLYYYIAFYGTTAFNSSMVKFINISDIPFFFFPIYSLYNIFKIYKLKNKRLYLKQIGIEIIQFTCINIIMTLIISTIIWIKRDVKLIEITQLKEYTFSYIFLKMTFELIFYYSLIVLLLNTKKLMRINKFICIRLIPMKIVLLFILYIFGGGGEMICPWNILEDTERSINLNIYDVDKIEIGMTKDDVIKTIGDPYKKYENKNGEFSINWTRDGGSKRGDYAWYQIRIEFKNYKVINVERGWIYD